jgi:putative DNA primase/helicase
MDIVSDFLAECCETGQDFTVLTRDLYKAYKEWCEANGDSMLKKNAFGSSLGEKGFVPTRFSKGLRGWEGLKIKSA